MQIDKKVRFRDLSAWLKVAVVTSYVMLVIYGLVFIIGFILGVIES